jgi:hypothetical protein
MEKMNKSVYQGNDIPKNVIRTILDNGFKSTVLSDLYGFNPWGEYDDIDYSNFKLVYVQYNIYKVLLLDHSDNSWHDMFKGEKYYVRYDEID